jgi:hypothetical protein
MDVLSASQRCWKVCSSSDSVPPEDGASRSYAATAFFERARGPNPEASGVSACNRLTHTVRPWGGQTFTWVRAFVPLRSEWRINGPPLRPLFSPAPVARSSLPDPPDPCAGSPDSADSCCWPARAARVCARAPGSPCRAWSGSVWGSAGLLASRVSCRRRIRSRLRPTYFPSLSP